ncbi:hypothetical protein DHEL01_v210402 [Diaporthe helianthi]|uniref:Major facilitator superfamily (MFS) profile domain-containing protein n=1 Tax=Diaporthe helianthi TaxID=158607 RepID=A0A2P5HLT5_DIAHE|nr:hypothetical protein DHEL01_v210402 [Diaporthe helianthi]
MPPANIDIESPPAEGKGTHEDSSSPTSGSDKGPSDKAAQISTAALLRNPLLGYSHSELIADVDAFTEKYGLTEHRDSFRKGALVAQASNATNGFEKIPELSQDEKAALRKEITQRWDQPFMLYFLGLLCAGSAIVQICLLNGAPYAFSALFGCWTSPFLNKWMGRRGTIFISCFFSVVTGFWMAAADSWYNLLIARFGLGLAVGAKSSTTPECAPKAIRGALTMMWQMWTASTSVPPLIVMLQVFFCPESPRWYMEKGKYTKAFQSVQRLRRHTIQATRDMYYAHKLLEVETKARSGHSWKEFFTVRRNRRAATFSYFVMFMQQFCGINVVMYYSTAIFQQAGFDRNEALLTSMGMGLINWLFALPAFYTIDTFGRRNLLLVTFPLMSLSLIFTAFSFYIPAGTGQLACVATGIYLFAAVYSPGAGPVPFTYCAEAFPLHIRDIGMSSATAVTWGFNFIISFTWPMMMESFTPTGAFLWYAGWNVVGFVVAYFFLPETKGLTLEELDSVFAVRNRDHAQYYANKAPWYTKKYLLRRDVAPFPALYEVDDLPGDSHHGMQEKSVVQKAERGSA